MNSATSALRFGVILGAAFGCANLVFTLFDPLADDTVGALVLFYGPMLCMLGLAGFLARRSTGSFWRALLAGALVGAVTLAVFHVATLVRVNVFLSVLVRRADWQGLMSAYRTSGASDLRAYVSSIYLEQTVPKILAGLFLGVTLGGAGALVAGLGRAHERAVAAR